MNAPSVVFCRPVRSPSFRNWRRSHDRWVGLRWGSHIESKLRDQSDSNFALAMRRPASTSIICSHKSGRRRMKIDRTWIPRRREAELNLLAGLS
jgi:hypothetical protein